MSIFEIVTVFALLLGPIIAVVISRHMDERRARRERRMDVFRTLMRTRRATVGDAHVSALNLVQVEFEGVADVITAWRKLMDHFNNPPARRMDEEIINDLSPEQKRSREQTYNQRLVRIQSSLLADLLYQIAKDLGIQIQQLDILEGGYSPQAQATLELQQHAARDLLVQLYLGERALPVEVRQAPNPESARDDQDPRATGE